MKRDFLTVTDLREDEVRTLLRETARLKRRRTIGRHALANRTIALVFEKPSLRTRVSFEVAIRQLGGSSIFLGPDEVQLGEREPIKDVARTLSRYVDAIVLRMLRHRQVEGFARYASVPILNGLSELHHPCQALADLFTIQERFGKPKGLVISYIGDGNNVLHSLSQGASLLGANLHVATPNGYRPDRGIWSQVVRQAKAHHARIVLRDDPEAVVSRADVIYTDVWASMGDEQEQGIRRKAFRQFQVNRKLLRLAKPHCLVMHCLPAHRGEEITENVLEGPRSIVFDQAENRLHVQKALLLMLFAGKMPR